jgi:hypothetical protein
MKTKKELQKDINYWLDLTGTPKYSCTSLKIEINAGLSITAVSRTRITFKKTRKNYSDIYDVNISSKDVTPNILEMILKGLMKPYQSTTHG